jgi:hypothetical protein
MPIFHFRHVSTMFLCSYRQISVSPSFGLPTSRTDCHGLSLKGYLLALNIDPPAEEWSRTGIEETGSGTTIISPTSLSRARYHHIQIISLKCSYCHPRCCTDESLKITFRSRYRFRCRFRPLARPRLRSQPLHRDHSKMDLDSSLESHESMT